MNSHTFLIMAVTVLRNTAYQLVFTVGVIIVFGLIVGILSQAFFRLSGFKFGRIIGMVTGFIGVPIHEFGHAFFCVLFRHRIIEIKLYEPNNADGVLGYVNHAYRRKSPYQQIGNFFIGFGPILFGSALLLLLMYLLAPGLYKAFATSTDFSKMPGPGAFSLATLSYIFGGVRQALTAFYTFAKPGDWRWWVFIIPACSIAMHMSLSPQDIKSSWPGFWFIVVIIFLANIILYFARINAIAMLTKYCLAAGVFLLHYLTISIVFSLILLVLGIVVRIIMVVTGRV